MPDFGAPVAQNVDVSPNKGLQTLGELMGLQQKQIGIQQQQQNLATGQFLQQQQQAEAQRQQQAMGTRQAATKMAQSGQDLQGNSIRGDDGEFRKFAARPYSEREGSGKAQAAGKFVLCAVPGGRTGGDAAERGTSRD